MSTTERLAFLLSVNAEEAIRGFQKTGDAADRELGRTEDKLKKAGSTLTKFGAGGLAFAGVMGGALFSVANSASDVSEAVNKATVLFGTAGKRVEEFANTAATSIGQSKRAALDATGTFGNFFRGIGDTADQAADKSIEFTKLAGDLASFHNAKPEEAVEALGAALRGESEPVRRFGVLLDDATLKQRALSMGLIETTTGTLPPAIKAQAAYAEILKQTKSAQGDFAKTSDGAANQQRILTAQMENLKASIGAGVLPVMTDFLGVLNGALEMFQALPSGVQEGAGKLLAFGTAGIGAASAISLIAGQIIKFIEVARGMNATLAAASPWLLAVAGAAALGTAAIASFTASKVEAKKRTEEFTAALRKEKDGIEGATDALIAQKLASHIDDAKKLGLSVADLARIVKGEQIPAYEELKKQAAAYVRNSSSGVQATDAQGKAALDLTRQIDKLRSGYESGTKALADSEAQEQKVKEASDALGVSQEVLAQKTGAAERATKAAEAAQKDAEKAELDRIDTLIDQRKAIKDLADAELDRLDATLATFDSELGMKKAHDDTTVAIKALATAKGKELAPALQEATEKVLAEASAFARLQDDQAKANGETLSAAEKQQAIKTKLAEVAATLAPGSPLRKQLEEYIGRLDAVPTAVSTVLDIKVPQGAGDRAFWDSIGVRPPGYDNGGTIPGPEGQPRLIVAHGGETLVPTHKDNVRSPVTAAGATTVIVYAQTNASAADIGRDVAWAWRVQ